MSQADSSKSEEDPFTSPLSLSLTLSLINFLHFLLASSLLLLTTPLLSLLSFPLSLQSYKTNTISHNLVASFQQNQLLEKNQLKLSWEARNVLKRMGPEEFRAR